MRKRAIPGCGNSFFQNYNPGSSRAVNFSSNACIFYSGMLLLKLRDCPGEYRKGLFEFSNFRYYFIID